MTVPDGLSSPCLTWSNTRPDWRVPKPQVAGSNPAGGRPKRACELGIRALARNTPLNRFAQSPANSQRDWEGCGKGDAESDHGSGHAESARSWFGGARRDRVGIGTAMAHHRTTSTSTPPVLLPWHTRVPVPRSHIREPDRPMPLARTPTQPARGSPHPRHPCHRRRRLPRYDTQPASIDVATSSGSSYPTA